MEHTDSLRSSVLTDGDTTTLTSELDVDPEAGAVFVNTATELPWGASKERINYPSCIHVNTQAKPGEFVLQSLFAEFTVLTEKKIDKILTSYNPSEDKLLTKTLQRGEDAAFEQLLNSLSTVALNCLPSLLSALFDWYQRQNPTDNEGHLLHKHITAKTRGEKDDKCEKRDLAIDVVYCLVLIDVLKQLSYHPGHDDLVNHIIHHAFMHFRYREGLSAGSANDVKVVADLYAEVIGVLAQSRFMAVKKRFSVELKELRLRDQSSASKNVISLLMGLKFFRVKMHPIEDFQACVQFLHELGSYFLEVKEKEIKHSLAGLFVEILLPVAAVAKMEVNVPVLKIFVEMMYTPTLDMSSKKKHNLALFPLVTCLLCVSQKAFFLTNWPNFLTLCLSKLKDREPKMARVALESLYRLLWVYMIRIKCESNATTISRLQSIVQSLFPKGAKATTPRDARLNIFVKIIQFIAQERLDFAMREIIFDLLCVGKSIKMFSPERMSIGLRAFLVIADSLQQKDGEPPMPQTGSTLRFKKTFINKYLSEEMARTIGMSSYYGHVCKAFDAILKYLDQHVGKPLLMCKPENINREELITTDRKTKIDLFRTCVAAIPRLLPDGMPLKELIDLLSRLTVHADDELGKLAFQSLQNVLLDLTGSRNDVLHGFVQFIEKEISDTMPQLLDQCNRRLIALVTQRKSIAQSSQTAKEKNEEKAEAGRLESVAESASSDQLANQQTIRELEGYALVMLCSCKPIIRKQAVLLLKELRNLASILNMPKCGDPSVLDVMDKSCHLVFERVLPHLPLPEKVAALSASPVDFQWLADRTSIIWTSGGVYQDHMADYSSSSTNPSATDSYNVFDPWIECMSIFMKPDYVMNSCPTAVGHAWPILFCRLQALFVHVDPNVVMNESRTSSILRGSRKVTTERDMYMSLWKNYVVMGCCIAPPSILHEPRSMSPDLNSSPETPIISQTTRELCKILVPLLKCEMTDMRESIVVGLSHISPAGFRDLIEEMLPVIREAIDRKGENVKRKRKRDLLRLVVVRVFHYMAENGIFAQSPADVIEPNTEGLCSTFVEYIDGGRQYLESEADKESDMLKQIRFHFSEFIRHLVRHTPVPKRYKFLSANLKQNLFMLFSSWSGKLGLSFAGMEPRSGFEVNGMTELEQSSVQAMSAILCCGPAFDPSSLNDDNDQVYQWLNTLLGSHEDKIYKLAQETIVLLLEFNPDAQALLDWVIDRCYTANHEVADGCFSALATVFSNRDYPCDHVAMLNLTLLNTGCPRISVQETAVQLLHLLYKRFYLDDIVVTMNDTVDTSVNEDAEDGEVISGSQLSEFEERKKMLQEKLLAGPYSRFQLYLSQTLAKLHPLLTMPMFSEITHRFQTAIPSLKQLLLQYLIPWLYNLELNEPNLPQPRDCLGNVFQDYPKPPLRGEGWGSPEATEMVLNNLLYITAQYGDDHAKEIEELWAAIVTFWPGNLQVIIRYIIIVTSMSPATILPHAKRVIVYLGRAKAERLVDELMNELRTIEPLTFSVERTPTPPFYRLTSLKKQPATIADADDFSQFSHLDKGQIHTKRHSGEDPTKADENCRSSVHSLRSDPSAMSSSSVSVRIPGDGEEGPSSPRHSQESAARSISPAPVPLPMPAYGGFFAPLSDFLPENNLPNPPYQRCNLAVMLLTDLVVDCVFVDWTVHLPLILHIIFLGLDHSRPLIHEDCKKLLLNLILVLTPPSDHFSVAKILLAHPIGSENSALTLPSSSKDQFEASYESSCSSVGVMQTGGASDSLTTDSVSSLPDPEIIETTDEVITVLLEFLVTRKCRPLWSYEDITSKVHNIKSAEQMDHFLKFMLRIFKDCQPMAHVEQRWAQEALHLALSCSSRHYAGRSFQVFRALRVLLSSSDLSDILSRLVETVSEQGEDMQGYVTEIILTLESTVDNLDVDMKPLMREIFLSTPNLNKEARMELRKSATITPLRQTLPKHTAHYRSTSCRESLSLMMRRSGLTSPIMDSKGEVRHHRHSSGDMDSKKKDTNLKRSTSAQSLKQLQDPMGQDDKLTILSQMFWIAVSLLESDYEYEFLLAVRLLEKILKHIQPDRPECKEKLDKIQQQLSWMRFPGVQALLLKGCTSSVTAEATWALLAKTTLNIKAAVIDPSQSTGFPMNVMALLPYMVEHYEEPNELCTEAANNIAQMCREQSHRLDNLGHIMTRYSVGMFGKDSFQWTKCVVKYLYDVYASMNESLVSFLAEVLEKGPNSIQMPVLQILHCIAHNIDLTSSSASSINSDLLRVVTKYIESCQWKEALEILKLCVMRSSTLSAPPPSPSPATVTANILDSAYLGLAAHTSFAEVDIPPRKELPGRTIEFSFDVSHVPLIGRKQLDLPAPDTDRPGKDSKESTIERGAEAVSNMPKLQSDHCISDWKRPHLSQERTRKRLRNLLTCYGHTVLVPASPSVIFSQESPSDTLARQASMCSSSEETSLNNDRQAEDMKIMDDSSGEQQALSAYFAFLDEPDPTDQFWGVNWQQQDVREDEEEHQGKDLSDDEVTYMTHSVSPVDDFHHELPSCPTITLHNSDIPVDIPALPPRGVSVSESMQSLPSAGSDLDTTLDLSPSTASPTFSLGFAGIPGGEEWEEDWASHVTRVMMDGSGAYAVKTFFLFSRLFRESHRRVENLTKDACEMLDRMDSVKNIAGLLTTLLGLMATELDCPLVYMDTECLMSSGLLERHKLSVQDIDESYETFRMRKIQAVECIEQMKTTITKEDIIPDSFTEDRKMLVCRCLYRLHFQLVQLFEAYTKLVEILTVTKKPAHVHDISTIVSEFRQELTAAVLTYEMEQELQTLPSTASLDVSTTTRDEAERLLVEALNNRDFRKALIIVRTFRSVLQGDMFGVHPADEVETLLHIYCKTEAEANPGVIMVSASPRSLQELSSHLMEIKVQVSFSLQDHRCDNPSPTVIKVCSPEVSEIEQHSLGRPPDSSTL